MVPLPNPEAYAYTDGASSGSRGPGGYGVVLTWKGKIKEISGGEQNTTNQRMEVTAACIALETIDEGQVVTIDRKSTRLNSSHANISYAVFCLKKKALNPLTPFESTVS